MTKRIPLTKWKLQTKNCSCEICKGMCVVPCWPTPDEAKRLIRLGYGNKLMLNSRYLEKANEEIYILCPAKKGQETQYTKKEHLEPGCTFQTKILSLKSIGSFPLQIAKRPSNGLQILCNKQRPFLELWNTKEAQELVLKWMKEFMKQSFHTDLVTKILEAF